MSDHEDSRPPIDAAAAATPGPVARGGGRGDLGSTNADVADRFRAGEGEGLVLVAEHQTAGRGRLGREWVSPAPRVADRLLPAGAPDGRRRRRWAWLPLLTGVATAGAVRRATGVEVDLKWPNDVLAGGLKLGGILLERVEHDGSAPPPCWASA